MPARDERVDDLLFNDLTTQGNPSEEGVIRYVSGDLVAFLGGTVKSLTSGVGGSGITQAQHEALDTLKHLIAENSHTQIVRSRGRVDSVTWFADATETTKIRECTFTRTSGLVSSVAVRQYDAGGSLSVTLTGTVTRVSGKVDSIDWVVS